MTLTLSLGILFAAGMVAVMLANWLEVPRVTLYVVVGLLVGPSLLDWIPGAHLEELDPVLKLALAMVLLEIGGRFTFTSLRRIIRAAVPLSGGELTCTFVLVAVGLWAIGEDLEVAILLGGLALATAPATTIVVLRDYDSEGPVTALTYALVALNNLVAIVAFELLFVLVSLLAKPAGDVGTRLWWLATDLVGSTAAGIVAGMAASLIAARLTERQRPLALLAVITLALGLCEWFHIPYLLTFLAMGVTLANASSLMPDLLRGLDPITGLLYVVFFVAAGAELDIRALWAAGAAGAVYILMRCTGKYIGVRMMARVRREPQEVQQWLGLTLIAQAGAAIGLVHVAAERAPELGGHLQTIIVGTVIFFEVAGPILTRMAVVRAGEVPVAHLARPNRLSWREAGLALLGGIRRAFGGDPWAGRPREELRVRDLMRQNVRAIAQTDDFLKILEFIERSRHHVYPVVGAAGDLVGVIRYRDIRSTLFNPELAALVRAEDLCHPARWTLHPDQSIDDALAVVEKTSDDVIPVVAGAADRTLIGLIERRDIVRFVKGRYHTPKD